MTIKSLIKLTKMKIKNKNQHLNDTKSYTEWYKITVSDNLQAEERADLLMWWLMQVLIHILVKELGLDTHVESSHVWGHQAFHSFPRKSP